MRKTAHIFLTLFVLLLFSFSPVNAASRLSDLYSRTYWQNIIENMVQRFQRAFYLSVRIPSPTPSGVPTPSSLPTELPTSYPTPTQLPASSPTDRPVNQTPSPSSTPTPDITPAPTASPSPTASSQNTPTLSPIPTTEASPSPSDIDIRSFILGEVNIYRTSLGLSQVSSEEYTCNFARIRAQEVSEDFSHDGFSQRADDASLPYPSYTLVTENLSHNPDYTQVVSRWIDSPGHAENMRKDTPYVCIEKYADFYVYEGWKP